MNISVKRLAIIGALVVVLAAGCGGSKKSSFPTQVSAIPSSASCDKKGISTDEANAGTCVASGTRITVANKARWLAMKDYAARVTDVRTADRVGDFAGPNFTPEGKFVVVSLQAKNTGKKAQRFDPKSNMAYLLLDGKEYAEVAQAEEGLAGSFHADGKPIEPGAVGNGTVVFDAPAKSVEKLGDAGSHVVFLDTYENENGYPRLGFPTLGFIRLWK
jgi:hypothetical protein